MAAAAWLLMTLLALSGSTWGLPLQENNIQQSSEVALTSQSSKTNETIELHAEEPTDVIDDDESKPNGTELEADLEEESPIEEEDLNEEVQGDNAEENEVKMVPTSSLTIRLENNDELDVSDS